MAITTDLTNMSPLTSASESEDDFFETSSVPARKESGPSALGQWWANKKLAIVTAFTRKEKEVTPDRRSSTEVNKVFRTFLEQKAQNGGKFTLRERFNYNCMEYIDAKGLAKFKAFVKIGGFGAIAAGKFTEEQKTDLRNQFEFHRAMTRAVDYFNRFANPGLLSLSPTRVEFENAKKAFEAVLAVADENTTTNQIMNSVTGKQVANTLIEAEAHYQLTDKDGKVTPDTILNTFNSHSFLDMIDTFRGKGYRPVMTEVEAAKADDYDGVTTENKAFDALMSDADRVPFYMAYARVYNKIYNDSMKKDGPNSGMARMHRQTVKSLEAPSNGQIEEAIEENNEHLFALIKEAPMGLPELPFGVETRVYSQMVALYREYAEDKALLVTILRTQGELQPVFDAAKTAFENFSVNMSLSYQELSEVFGEQVDESLPGAEAFLRMKQEIEKAQQDATQTTEEIATRKAQLEEQLGQAKAEKARLEKVRDEADGLLNSYKDQFEKKKLNPYEELVDESMQQLSEEHKQKLEEYNAAKKAISAAAKLILDHSRELESINNNTHDLCQRLQEANTLRQDLIQRKVKLAPVTVAELAESTQHKHVERLMQEYNEKDRAYKAVSTLVDQNDDQLRRLQGQLAATTRSMTARGFIFEDGVVAGVEYPAFKSADYKAELKQHMINAGQTTRMLVVQMRQLMKSDDELNAEEAAKALKAKKVVAAPVATKPEVNTPVEWDDEKSAVVPPPSLFTPDKGEK